MRKIILITCSIFLLTKLVLAQSNISGIINQYQAVAAIDTCLGEVILDDIGDLQIGMKVLLIQMKGATIDESDASSFGNILNLNHAGNFEKAEIKTIIGSSIFLKHKLIHQYTPTGLVQVVSIPTYENATVIDTLKAKAWDGSTGGILVFEVLANLDLNAPISTTGQGFRGGEITTITPNECEWFFNPSSYYYELDDWEGSRKGEGIAAFIIGKEAGRGAQANGGGGGNDHNAGGGGGANIRSGGKGGRNEEPSNFGCSGLSPGIGGKAISTSNNKIFLGGGGGAGHSNNNMGTSGGNGGGIIIITANSIQGNNNFLAANGAGVLQDALGDGAGGGGAGGTIVLNAISIEGLQIEAKGGKGGTMNNNLNPRCMGPGGGGSGGRLLVDNNSLSSSSVVLDGGISGLSINSSACSDSPNEAEAGINGVQEISTVVTQGTEEILPTQITIQANPASACVGDTVSFQITAVGNDLNYQWQIETMNGFQDLINGTDYTGTKSANLMVYHTTLLQNGTVLRCLVFNNCFPLEISDELTLNVKETPIAGFTYTINEASVQGTNQSTNATNYIWDFGDNSGFINTENPVHEYLQSGQYEISLIASNECGTDTSTSLVDIMIVATNDIQDAQRFEIYPNPARNFLVISFPMIPRSDFSLQVLGIDGKILLSKKYSNTTKKYILDLHEFPSGVYTIQLTMDAGLAIQKFVKF